MNGVLAHLMALVWAIASASVAFFVQDLADEIHTGELFMWKSLTQVIVMLPLMYRIRHEFLDYRSWLGMMALLCVAKSVSTLTLYKALMYISVSDVSVLVNSRCVFTLPLAKFWLKEKVHIIDLISMALSLMGIVMMFQPAFLFGHSDVEMSWGRVIGITFSLMSAAFNSVTRCIQRKERRMSFEIMVLIPSMASVGLGGVEMALHGEKLHNIFVISKWHLFAGFLFLSVGCSIVQVVAAQRIPAISMVIIAAIRITATVLLDIIIMGAIPNIYTIFGLILSTLSIILLPLKGWLEKNKKPISDEETELLNTDSSSEK